MRPVAVVGNLSLDSVDGGPLRIGGGAYYGALALRLLGRRGHVVARYASADRAKLLPQLAALGIPVTVVPGLSTARFTLSYDGDRRDIRVDALGDPWDRADARAALAAAGRVAWVHVAPLARGEFGAEALAELSRGPRLSLDGQGLVRAPRLGPLELDRDHDPDVLRCVSVLKLAEEEAALVADSGRVPEVTITRGSRGSLVVCGGARTGVPAHAVDGVDPTGAGDVFAVGYVAARADGLVPSAAARRATALVARLLASRRRADT